MITGSRLGHSCSPNGTIQTNNATATDDVHHLDPTAGLCPSGRNEFCDPPTATCRCIDGHSYDSELAHCVPQRRITFGGVLMGALIAIAVGLLAHWLNRRWRESRQRRMRLLEELSGDAEATVYQRPMRPATAAVELTPAEREKQYDFYRREREREQREELAAVQAAAAKASTNGAFSI